MSELLSAIWVPKDQRMVCADLKQHHVSWQRCLKMGYRYDDGHEVTWPRDDDGTSIRIRALGEDGKQLQDGSAEFEIIRADILRLYPTRGEMLCNLLRQMIGPGGVIDGPLDLSFVTEVTPELAEIFSEITQTGDLDLRSLQSLDAGALPALAQTGDLDLSSLQSAPEGFLPKLAQTGTLDISSDKLRRAIRAITTHNRGAAEVPSR